MAVTDGAPLIGEPEEPTPGTPRRLVPHATAGNLSWSRSYSYDDAGNITNIGDQQFVYDALGRLHEMATSGTTTEQYGYDRYGNQTSRSLGGVPQPLMDADAITNRLMPSTGYSYDRGGNVISGDSYTLSYDALGQAATKTYTAATTFNETYIYTAGEERIGVQTSNSGETSSWWYWSVRDEGGKVLRQYRSSALDPTQTALWIEDYVYRDGLLLGAERPPTLGGRRHFHLDHLGSPRLITSNDGQIVSSHDYLPFGGETTSVYQETASGFDREDPMKFTGHERDYAGGFGREVGGDAIDYMHARFYSPTVGRFLSVDPVGGDARLPQSWNRYSYANNSPMILVDPDGRSSVTFDPKHKTVTLLDECGNQVATASASNNPQKNPATAAPLAAGRHKFIDKKAPHTHGTQTSTATKRDSNGDAIQDKAGNDIKITTLKDSTAGEFGSSGIFRLEPIIDNVPSAGTTHEGIGLHSGRDGMYDRAGRGGWDYTTKGCVRTTDAFMSAVASLAKHDPLTYLEVQVPP